ncbi:MAG: hypothetical protein JW892_17755 [Anaerolineae bacterium]|nr:hypothetical protein [Anaerolineae bacterium]
MQRGNDALPDRQFGSQQPLPHLLLLGKGTFAAVYRAVLVELVVHRALKVLRRDAPGLAARSMVNHRHYCPNAPMTQVTTA